MLNKCLVFKCVNFDYLENTPRGTLHALVLGASRRRFLAGGLPTGGKWNVGGRVGPERPVPTRPCHPGQSECRAEPGPENKELVLRYINPRRALGTHTRTLLSLSFTGQRRGTQHSPRLLEGTPHVLIHMPHTS